MPAPDLPRAVQLVAVSPPVMAPPGTSGRGRITVGVDYLERQAGNRDVGLKGERLVIDYERARLAAGGRPDLADRVAHVASTLGDGAGYDVSSFMLDGSPHHIEVKPTRGIYRVFDLGPSPGFYKLTGDMAEILNLTPVSYQARVKAPGAHSPAHG